VVHDEIVCDVPRGYMPQYRKLVEEAWLEAGEKVIPGIPMAVDMASGFNWGVKK
jgi:DNA polymerase I-like protein with 3'-5' exonuclease and polymerase domains